MTAPESGPTSPPATRFLDREIPTWLGLCLIGGVFLLVVYAIMPNPAIERSKIGAASGDIGAFNSALALYSVDITAKQFPMTLRQLLDDNAVGWAGPYMATIGPDPWGNEYLYTGGAASYTILSIHDDEKNKSETIRYVLNDGILSTLP